MHKVMTATDPATLAAIKGMAQQAADIALAENAERFSKIDRHLSRLEAEIPTSDATTAVPPPLRWAAAIIAGLMTAGVAALAFWLVSSVNEMQQTLVRIDERQKASTANLDRSFADYDRRIGRLESFHKLEGDGS